MAIALEKSPTWEDIDECESYLVCCMFEEAASSSSAMVRKLNERCGECDENYRDMLESAGMVLVQSLRQLGRTSEIMKELKMLFHSIIYIPVQVFLTGVCFQLSDDPSFGIKEILEEFLSKWEYVDEDYYVLASAESNAPSTEELASQYHLRVDEYLEVVELYVVTFLGTILRNLDLAISWVEKASLPEEKRQKLLRRLYSMNSSNLTSSSQAFVSHLRSDEGSSPSLKEVRSYTVPAKDLEQTYKSNRQNTTKEMILKLSRAPVPCFLWFRTITLKFGSRTLVVSNGNILLGCFVLLMYYLLRRKQATVNRILRKQALFIKKSVIDLWQLAFSYQVNPLAAVQPLSAATRGSH